MGIFSFTPPSLDTLAVRCRTDKSHEAHNFAAFYDRYFQRLRDQPIRLLEIGVGRGASLRMWRKYFRKGTFFAIESQARRYRYRFLGAKIFIGQQQDTAFLKSVMEETGPLDIIIDDGSHHVPDQQITLGFLFPYLKDGGYYVIEDLHTSFWPDCGGRVDGNPSTYQMLTDFRTSGKFVGEHLSSPSANYLSQHVSECQIHIHDDKAKHMTSLLKKKG